jgi:hypothetical protein
MENVSLELAEAPTDVVGIREAATALEVAASTISRQVKNGIIPNRGSAFAPKVSISEARTARAERLDPAQRRPPQIQAAAVTPGYNTHRTAHEETKAKKAALELAQMQGDLVARAEVEDFLATVARQFRDKLLHRWRTLAVELEGLPAREIEAKCLAGDEALLSSLADEFESWGSDADGGA